MDGTLVSEAELLARCRRGEAVAWEELFARHYEPSARFINQLGSTLTREDVEEICQETFLSVIKQLPSFHGKSQFQTWLFRIAANKARDYVARQQAAKRGGGQPPRSLQESAVDDERTLDPPSPLPGPDLELLNAERQALVSESMRELGPPCQELLELRYFGDCSYEEIAASLDLHPKTVSSRLSRCLDRLEAIVRERLSSEARL